jgi:hypothetical protein
MPFGSCTEAVALSNVPPRLMVFAMIPPGVGIAGTWADLGALLEEPALPARPDRHLRIGSVQERGNQ